jgi:beta-N-acetylhexosaminidase
MQNSGRERGAGMNSGYIIISLAGTSVSTEEEAIICHPKVGGVILFSENFTDPNQLRQLIEQIRQLRRQAQPIAPELLIMVDQEGGAIQRFISGFSRLPAPVIYGGLCDWFGLEFARFVAYLNGWRMARELRQCDVDISLAPSLDVALPGSEIIAALGRGMHRDRQVIGQLASGFAHGMYAAGMPVTGKHFPTHGFCTADSHIALPVDQRTRSEILADLIPYQQLLAQGLLDLVMPGHIYFPQLVDDDRVPGSFAKQVIQDLLRDELGFPGVIISDCMSMGAIDAPPVTRVNRALSAGQDMIIYSHQSLPVMRDVLTDCQGNSEQARQRINRLTEQCRVKNSNLPHAAMAFAVQEFMRQPGVYNKVIDAVRALPRLSAYVADRLAHDHFITEVADSITGQAMMWPVMLLGEQGEAVFDLTTLLALPVDERGYRHHPFDYRQERYQFTLEQLQPLPAVANVSGSL